MFFFHRIPKDKILVAKVAKAYGVKGDVRIHCFSEQPENMMQYKRLFLLDENGRISVPLSVRNCRLQGKSVIIGFEGINNRNQVDELLGAGVLIAKTDLLQLPDDQFYWFQYLDKEVVTCDGQLLGKVTNLLNNGAQDILVIQTEDQEEVLIPVTKEILIAEEKKRLVIAPPPGLIEINRSE